jgi:hypothetical protein
MPTLLEALVSQLKANRGNGIIVVHANEETCNEIMDGLQEMYIFMDFTYARMSRVFRFDIDNITLKFEFNPYIEERHFRLIPERFFIEQQYLTVKDLGLIYRSEYYAISTEVRQDCINFCIANAIAFIPVCEKIHIHEIYTNSAYRYVFLKEHMCNYYKKLPPKWDN